MIKKYSFQKIFLLLFLVSIFFFKIPSFYFLPQIQNSFLTTQSFARAIILLLFIIKTGEFILNRQVIFKNLESKRIVLLCTLLFFLQSLSVVEAINMVSFLNRYKDLIIGLCSLFVFFYFRSKSSKIVTVFLYSVLLNSAFQFLMLFDTSLFLSLFSPFLYKNYFSLLLANLDRGRIYVPTFDEIVIPFLFIPSFYKDLNQKALQIVALISITFYALASNIRSSVLVLGIGFVLSLFTFRRNAFSKIMLVIGGIFIIGYLTNILLVNFVGFSFYDRLTFQSQAEDVDTVSQRGEQISQAFSMANSRLLGVGLGNYYDNVNVSKIDVALSESRRVEIRSAREYIHNIFATIAAESGYISLAVFFVILMLFVKQDVSYMKGKNAQKKAFVIAFWALFSWGLVNPPVSGSYQVLFWGIRGLLLV